MEFFAKSRNNRTKNLNFEYGIRPIYYLSRTMGLWPFSIVHDSNGAIQRAQIRRIDALWFVISIAIYFTATLISFECVNRAHIGSLMILIFNYISQIVGLAFGTLIIAMDMCNRNRIANILEMFTAFDNEV